MATIATLLWRRIDLPGAEYFLLKATRAGWQLAGTVLVADEARPFQIQYVITTDRAWQTRRVKVAIAQRAEVRKFELQVDAEQRWWRGEEELTQFRGHVDIDLGFTPSTNTLPIRRLNLPLGRRANVMATWLDFPSFELRPLAQTYAHISEQRYRYESNGGRYTNELTINALGLVSLYPDLWICEAEQ